MHFCVIGRDGTDQEAAVRRNAARPAHRESAAQLERDGHLICGGAIVNEKGNSVGSVLLMDFATEEEFEDWLNNEPFVTQGVWKTVEKEKFRITVAQSLPEE